MRWLDWERTATYLRLYICHRLMIQWMLKDKS